MVQFIALRTELRRSESSSVRNGAAPFVDRFQSALGDRLKRFTIASLMAGTEQREPAGNGIPQEGRPTDKYAPAQGRLYIRMEYQIPIYGTARSGQFSPFSPARSCLFSGPVFALPRLVFEMRGAPFPTRRIIAPVRRPANLHEHSGHRPGLLHLLTTGNAGGSFFQ